ncbi:hypothetical protein DFP72DRAFT_857917 [Ephemerocybe angulata]|uniref:Uncharacterized protein n=1 Tax=Ephemerocybe angulata TaxID=980116 RepID=A0A8H6LU91_9AGAR|nr:hypothetical protein DFP72DRAFT_857917 [Tulosesus angulatus]
MSDRRHNNIKRGEHVQTSFNHPERKQERRGPYRGPWDRKSVWHAERMLAKDRTTHRTEPGAWIPLFTHENVASISLRSAAHSPAVEVLCENRVKETEGKSGQRAETDGGGRKRNPAPDDVVGSSMVLNQDPELKEAESRPVIIINITRRRAKGPLVCNLILHHTFHLETVERWSGAGPGAGAKRGTPDRSTGSPPNTVMPRITRPDFSNRQERSTSRSVVRSFEPRMNPRAARHATRGHRGGRRGVLLMHDGGRKERCQPESINHRCKLPRAEPQPAALRTKHERFEFTSPDLCLLYPSSLPIFYSFIYIYSLDLVLRHRSNLSFPRQKSENHLTVDIHVAEGRSSQASESPAGQNRERKPVPHNAKDSPKPAPSSTRRAPSPCSIIQPRGHGIQMKGHETSEQKDAHLGSVTYPVVRTPLIGGPCRTMGEEVAHATGSEIKTNQDADYHLGGATLWASIIYVECSPA